jgi:hypothetical protein
VYHESDLFLDICQVSMLLDTVPFQNVIFQLLVIICQNAVNFKIML